MQRIFRFIFVLVVALLVCATSFGKVVDRKNAEKVAQQYLGTSVSCVWSPAEHKNYNASKESSAPAFNVFQGNGKWVIVAGEDCAVPILAHGDGVFPLGDAMPENMRAYLESLSEQILWARKEKLSADEETKWQWSHIGQKPMFTVAAAQNSKVEPLTKDILWNQNAPYNGKTPVINGTQAPTGCVATAVAIVMLYHRWPQYGKGIIPAYTTASRKIEMPAIDISKYKYNWDIMPYSLTSKSSDEEKEEVSTLMLHVGCMLQMDYCPGSSGTYESRIINPLVNNMSYRKSCTLLYASDFSHEEWFYMIKRELDAGRVIIYNAASASAGHCMVCDGYDESTRMVSANWGWGYKTRGWYVLNTMNGIHQGWPVDHSAIFGLEPDYDGGDDLGKFARFFFNENSKTGGLGLQLSENCTGIRKEGKFNVIFDQMDNKEKVSSVNVRMVLIGRNAAEKEIISDERTLSFAGQDAQTINSAISTDIECEIKGDYVIGDRIRCSYYAPQNLRWYYAGRWKPNVMHEFGAYNIDFIYFPSTMKAGQVYYPEFVYGGHLAHKSVVWYYDGVEMETRFPSVILEPGTHTVKAKVTYIDNSVRTIVATCHIE